MEQKQKIIALNSWNTILYGFFFFWIRCIVYSYFWNTVPPFSLFFHELNLFFANQSFKWLHFSKNSRLWATEKFIIIILYCTENTWKRKDLFTISRSFLDSKISKWTLFIYQIHKNNFIFWMFLYCKKMKKKQIQKMSSNQASSIWEKIS